MTDQLTNVIVLIVLAISVSVDYFIMKPRKADMGKGWRTFIIVVIIMNILFCILNSPK